MGGIPVGELNMLEREFLRMIHWRLTVSTLPFASNPMYPPPQRVRSTFLKKTGRLSRSPLPQCTREVLQEYYVNLVRTHSKTQYVISDPASSSSLSSDSELDVEMSSRPASPDIVVADRGNTRGPREASTILIDTATLSPRSPQPPTLEQNMAFAALQEDMNEYG